MINIGSPAAATTSQVRKDPFLSPPLIGNQQSGPQQLASALSGQPSQSQVSLPVAPTVSLPSNPTLENQPRRVPDGKQGKNQFQTPPLIGSQGGAQPDVFPTQTPQVGSSPINSAPQVFAKAGPQPTFQQSGTFAPTQTQSAGQLPDFVQAPAGTQNFTPQNIAAQNVAASQANAQTFNFGAFQPFSDAVIAEQNRTLEPQLRAEEAAFRQRLVGQGIQEGTRAFDDAFGNFSRSQNDARSSVRNNALAQALAVQNQMFGQSFSNAQLSQQASLANASNSLQAAGLNQQDRQFGANLGLQRQNSQNQFNLARSQLGESSRQFDAGLGSQERQFGANFDSRQAELANAFAQQNASRAEQSRQFDSSLGFNQQRADFNDLTNLFGLGTGQINQNNINSQQDFIRQLQLLGLAPGAVSAPAIDVNTPFAQQLAQQNAQTAARAANNQAFNQGLVGIGSALGGLFGG